MKIFYIRASVKRMTLADSISYAKDSLLNKACYIVLKSINGCLKDPIISKFNELWLIGYMLILLVLSTTKIALGVVTVLVTLYLGRYFFIGALFVITLPIHALIQILYFYIYGNYLYITKGVKK